MYVECGCSFLSLPDREFLENRVCVLVTFHLLLFFLTALHSMQNLSYLTKN